MTGQCWILKVNNVVDPGVRIAKCPPSFIDMYISSNKTTVESCLNPGYSEWRGHDLSRQSYLTIFYLLINRALWMAKIRLTPISCAVEDALAPLYNLVAIYSICTHNTCCRKKGKVFKCTRVTMGSLLSSRRIVK